MCTIVYNGIQESTCVSRGLQGYTRDYKDIEGFTYIRYATDYKGLQGFTRIYGGLKGYTEGLQRFKRAYSGKQEFTGVCKELQGLVWVCKGKKSF